MENDHSLPPNAPQQVVEAIRKLDLVKEVLEQAYEFMQRSEEKGSIDLYAYLEGAQDNIHEVREWAQSISAPLPPPQARTPQDEVIAKLYQQIKLERSAKQTAIEMLAEKLEEIRILKAKDNENPSRDPLNEDDVKHLERVELELLARAEPQRDEREQCDQAWKAHQNKLGWNTYSIGDEGMFRAGWTARSSAAPLNQTPTSLIAGARLRQTEKISELNNLNENLLRALREIEKLSRAYACNQVGLDILKIAESALASLPQPSLPQENADSLNTNSVAGDGLKTTPSAGQTEGK